MIDYEIITFLNNLRVRQAKATDRNTLVAQFHVSFFVVFFCLCEKLKTDSLRPCLLTAYTPTDKLKCAPKRHERDEGFLWAHLFHPVNKPPTFPSSSPTCFHPSLFLCLWRCWCCVMEKKIRTLLTKSNLFSWLTNGCSFCLLSSWCDDPKDNQTTFADHLFFFFSCRK